MCFSLIQPVQSCLIHTSEESYEASHVCIDIERGVHRARSCGVAACRLAKLLRHHRLLCCVADWIDVRGDHLDRGGSGARVEWGACGMRLANSRAFWQRATRRRE